MWQWLTIVSRLRFPSLSYILGATYTLGGRVLNGTSSTATADRRSFPDGFYSGVYTFRSAPHHPNPPWNVIVQRSRLADSDLSAANPSNRHAAKV